MSFTIVKFFYILFTTVKAFYQSQIPSVTTANIKNLLEYSPSYAEETASNEFFFLDTSRNAEEREFEVGGTNKLAKRRAAYKKGFALRKALLGTSSTVNTEIPLNRYC